MDNEKKDSKKEIEIVNGNGKDLLNFSEVYEHIKTSTNSNEEKYEKKEIVIPKGSSDKKD
ncbi:MAG: hypothetical protein J5507_02005 [Clostridia bacterium]|nr:hypothetical protein [Clostridia bacterium]